MTKTCPYCGVAIPSNCLTCPKCFRDIPRESSAPSEEYVINEDKRSDNRKEGKSMSTVKVLASFPAIIGLLGLGQIYLDHKEIKGYCMLLVGFLLFAVQLFLFINIWHDGFFSAILMFIAWLILAAIYISAAIGCFLDAMFGSVFKVIRY